MVPGGGAALLGCIPALEALRPDDPDEALGFNAIVCALAEPMRAILGNAGIDAAPIVDEARRRGLTEVYDVLRRDWVDAWTGGVVDPLAVVQAALESSVTTAALVLTSEVLVRRKNPPLSTTP